MVWFPAKWAVPRFCDMSPLLQFTEGGGVGTPHVALEFIAPCFVVYLIVLQLATTYICGFMMWLFDGWLSVREVVYRQLTVTAIDRDR